MKHKFSHRFNMYMEHEDYLAIRDIALKAGYDDLSQFVRRMIKKRISNERSARKNVIE
jgi:AraC-like DNA-binding protein